MVSSNRDIHLALAFDHNFLTHFYVVITSVFYNNRNYNIFLHIIVTGVSEFEKNKLKSYVELNNSHITFYSINEELVNSLIIPENSSFTAATYYRLFFPLNLPPSIGRLIYIDTDTVVVGNLGELYNAELDAIIGAVEDKEMVFRPELSLHKSDLYFNAGVLLINLDLWRKFDVTESTIKYISENPNKIVFADQDGLNAVLKGMWQKLDKRFNLMKADIPEELLQRDYKNFLKDVVIIHYNGRKPWKALCAHKFRHFYHYYLKRSPKSNQPKYVDFTFSKALLREFIKIRIVEFYLNAPFFKYIWRKLKR